MKESELKSHLTRCRQIKLSVVGRKSGKTISIPVWFVLEGEKLYLLAVQGSDTQWYKNVLKNPAIRVYACYPVPLTGNSAPARVASVSLASLYAEHGAICLVLVRIADPQEPSR
jgi:deazaflavin-dependent oxidoreductase (nitroreductase family)